MSTQPLTPATHYHPLTKTVFELGKCSFCNSTAALSPKPAEDMPAGVKIWGEQNLPAREMFADDLVTLCCSVCKGLPYYIENVKSEWAVIHRQTGAVADLKKSEKTATARCKELNDAAQNHNTPVAVNDAVDSTLTIPVVDGILPDMVIIRLAGDLPNGFKRGDHIQVPIADLSKLIDDKGVTQMAKAERKTAKEMIRGLIVKKKSDAEIIKAVQAAFPESQVDSKHCTKYRRELLVEGAIDASLAAVGSPDHRAWAQENLALAKKGPHGEYWKGVEVKQKEAAAAEKAKAKPAVAEKPKAAPKPKAEAKAEAKPKAASKPKAAPKPKAAATPTTDAALEI